MLRTGELPHPAGGSLALTAPLDPSVRAGFAWLGFEPDPELPGASPSSS